MFRLNQDTPFDLTLNHKGRNMTYTMLIFIGAFTKPIVDTKN